MPDINSATGLTMDELMDLDRLSGSIVEQMTVLTAAWCERHGMWKDDEALQTTILCALDMVAAEIIYTYVDKPHQAEAADEMCNCIKLHIASMRMMGK